MTNICPNLHTNTLPPHILQSLEEVIFVRTTHVIIFVVVVIVPKHIVVDVHRLLLRCLVLLLRLLSLSLNFALGLLDLLVLNHVASFDDVSDGVVIEDILALANDLFQKCCAEVDFSVALWHESMTRIPQTN